MKKGYMLILTTAFYCFEDEKLSVHNAGSELDDGFLLAMFPDIDSLIEHVKEHYELSEEDWTTLSNVSEESWTSQCVVHKDVDEEWCYVQKYQTMMIDISPVMGHVYEEVTKAIYSALDVLDNL